MSTPLDPLGHDLLKSRFKNLNLQLLKTLENNPLDKAILGHKFIITGVGSSEAHARFLTYLINNFTQAEAFYYPLSFFYNFTDNHFTNHTLIVFSQGLSPNAYMAIDQRKYFKNLIVFTAKSKEHLPPALIHESYFINFPLENEYDVLMRIIGPICGFLATIQFVKNNFESSISQLDQEDLDNLFKLENNLDFTYESLSQGSLILGPWPFSEFYQNICYKFIEGIFVPSPIFCDYISFCHGTLQQLIKNPKPAFILEPMEDAYNPFLEKLKEILIQQKISFNTIKTAIKEPWSILELEIIFTQFILKLIYRNNIDQKNWPGKNEDFPLYTIKKPLKV